MKMEISSPFLLELAFLPLETSRALVGICIKISSICIKCWHSYQCLPEEQSVLRSFPFVT